MLMLCLIVLKGAIQNDAILRKHDIERAFQSYVRLI